MDQDELVGRFKRREVANFKLVRSGVPDTGYETISAVSNSYGGLLFVRIQRVAGCFEIVRALGVDKVQKDFRSLLCSGQKPT